MVEHFMYNKKDMAIGVKLTRKLYRKSDRFPPPDEITNMEGAFHTFVTPIALCMLHGDYYWGPGHVTSGFKVIKATQQAPKVIISASIQSDSENTEVLLELCALQKQVFPGKALPANFAIPEVSEKLDETLREAYDSKLKAHMIYHLKAGNVLPAVSSVHGMTCAAAIEMIEGNITKLEVVNFTDIYVHMKNSPKSVISLEVFYNKAIHQFRNEFSARAAVAPQGYVYTFDPAAIFAKQMAVRLRC